MNEHEISDALEEIRVAPSPERDSLSHRWCQAPDCLVNAALNMLNDLSELGGITLEPLAGNGVSGYGRDPRGRRRECFHIGILSLDPRLIIYQHGEAENPRDFFVNNPPHDARKQYGYLRAEELGRVPDIQGVLRQSYANLTRH